MLADTSIKPYSRILVFDSGVGGLSVLKEISRHSPNAELVFASDNAAFPYGILSEEHLMERVIKVVGRLIEKTNPSIAVIACNSASTLVLEELRHRFDIPFVGVVPAIKPAAKQSKSKVIGLLATPGTIERSYTDALIADFASDCTLVRVGSSELVQMAEQKLRGIAPDKAMLKEIVAPFSEQQDLDVIVLACTHFPLLIEELEPLLPAKVHWIDSGEAIARRVESLLNSNSNLLNFNRSEETQLHHQALMTTEDDSLEALNQQAKSFGLPAFDILSL